LLLNALSTDMKSIVFLTVRRPPLRRARPVPY